MNYKNVENVSYTDYIDGLVKSLSNFCNKCPLKPTIRIVKELGIIYIYYKDKEIQINVDVNENKKKVIGDLKKKLEKEYPIIYKKITSVPNADEVRKILNQGKTLEEALNCTKVKYEPLYKIERIHDKYNELDLVSITDGEMYKFKCRIPVMAILEDLKYNGKDSDAVTNINLMYKISTYNEVVANAV